uniref:Uncharacterized protein n=1 Tax=Panagrolaimus sp. PS1159 TaxID=55785 RepID=A0AC35EXC3_9BILA
MNQIEKNSKNYELQPGASLDKVIDEISSKLSLLSGQDCEIEVDIRVKFPKNNKVGRGHRKSKAAATKAVQESHQQKENQQPEKPHQPKKHNLIPDFAFDIESYAKADAGNAAVKTPTKSAKTIERPPSPDIVTFRGMCNVEGDTSSCISGVSPSNSTSSMNTDKLFPVGGIRYQKQQL